MVFEVFEWNKKRIFTELKASVTQREVQQTIQWKQRDKKFVYYVLLSSVNTFTQVFMIEKQN